MTKKEIGEAILAQAKLHLRQNGYSMDNFPEDYPISRRSLYEIGNGRWTEAILKKLPFKVVVSYSVSFV